MDEVFGRKNRMSIITVVRSASTGHKAINPGPVNVTDFVLVYAVDRKQSPLYPLQRVRKTFDHAYSTFLENPKAPFGEWRFCPLRAQVAQVLGHDGTRAARKALGGEAFDQEVVRFALRNPSHVVRFAQPRYDAVGKRVQALIDASRKRKDQVLCLRRDKLPDFFVRNGNRILFLADKVISTADGPGLSEPLTNVWDDLPFQGIAKEGGVKFERNKKPERLLERVLNLGSAPGDLVLDPFVGSGTTAAVALKMGRSFIGVDAGDHLLSLAVPRLRAVLDGSDQSGIPGNPGERKRGFRVLEVR
jgi:adenine-specific DNA-methyltransferase